MACDRYADSDNRVCTGGGETYCADLESDERHCGACGHTCETGATCDSGRCERTFLNFKCSRSCEDYCQDKGYDFCEQALSRSCALACGDVPEKASGCYEDEIISIPNQRPTMSTTNLEVARMFDELRDLGASVETREDPYSEGEIAEVEDQLGFSLPTEYREFLSQFGRIAIEFERTWFFYGLEDGLEKTEEYRDEFDRMLSVGIESKKSGPYFPQRFFVLSDEGRYSNHGWGWVYDDDLDAMLYTAGTKWVEADSAISVGYWEFLLDELTEIRDRIADPEDVLVAGSDRELELRKARNDEESKTPGQEDALGQLDEAVERLYEVFDAYPRQRRERYCFKGACPDCKETDPALNDKPLRELSRKDLFHFAYFGLNKSIEPKDEWPDRLDEYKHFLPRILEIIEEIGMLGNPSIVIGTIFEKFPLLDLSENEEAAVEQYLRALWRSLLYSEVTTTRELRFHLHAFATAGFRLEDFLSVWESTLSSQRPLCHAARFVIDHDFERDAAYYGWRSVEPAFETLRAWLLSPDLRGAFALERRRQSDDGDSNLFARAVDSVRSG